MTGLTDAEKILRYHDLVQQVRARRGIRGTAISGFVPENIDTYIESMERELRGE